MRRRERILVVDDNREVADMLVWYLERRRYRVAWAYCGLTGLALAKVTKPDLVLLNNQMPGMWGLEVLRELRADPATAGLRVLMMSGSEQVGPLAAKLGAQGFIAYPVMPEELGRRVERALADA